MLDYSSDSSAGDAKDPFQTASLPSVKKQKVVEAPAKRDISAAPDVLSEDPLNQTSLLIRPTDTQMMVNIGYEDMTAPVVGPENAFAERRFQNQNTISGHVEEHMMTDHDFRIQHLTHNIHGYSQNPSVDASAPRYIGSAAAAAANNFSTIEGIQTSRASRRELKRKRKEKGDLETVDGDGAYEGPWAGWQGDGEPAEGFEIQQGDLLNSDEEAAEDAAEAARQADVRKVAKAKRSTFGQETSTFHGKSLTDYQGRTYMHPPLAIAPHLNQEAGSQECFIPKTCVHTFTGHTAGVSVIRSFPGTGHLFLSGSMDKKIKLWDVYNEGNCLRTFMGHHQYVKDVTFSNDGRRFLSCSFDRQMKLWDTETGQCLKAFSNGKIPHCIKFHPDEDKQNVFLAGMHDKKIIQYDMDSGDIIQEYDQHLGPVNTITFVDDNRRFVTTSDDNTIRAWDYDIPVVIKYIAEPDMHSMPAVTMHPSKKWFAAQSLDNQILVYSADNFRQNRKKRFAGHTVAGYACGIGFSPDGKWISSGDSSGNIVFWDYKSGRIKSRLRAHSKVVITHEWLPHETSKVLTASWDGLIKLWD